MEILSPHQNTVKYFANSIAKQCAVIINANKRSHVVLEYGAGTGALAVGILKKLSDMNCCMPEHYLIIEISANLIESSENERLKEEIPELTINCFLDFLGARRISLALLSQMKSRMHFLSKDS